MYWGDDLFFFSVVAVVVSGKMCKFATSMESQETYYVDVLLPLHLPGTYTYRVPRELVGEVRVGVRVVVQFGRRRIYSALVRGVHREAPRYRCKYVMGVLDETEVVGERQLAFWEWLARYYMCYPGDVMGVALPAGMKLASESAVRMDPDYDGDLGSLTREERRVVELLATQGTMKLEDLGRALQVQKVLPIVRGMVERGVVMMEEELRERYRPKKKVYVELAEGYRGEESLKGLFDELERKGRTKQVEVLLKLMQLSGFGARAVEKRLLPQGSALQTLQKNGVLKEVEKAEVGGLRAEVGCQRSEVGGEMGEVERIVLNEEQAAAYREMSEGGAETYLLHGVTSSGKTEVYIKLIADAVRAGGQVLFLLPEIALTAQVIGRLRRYFGDMVGVYHSRFSTSERVDVWRGTASGRYRVLLGARSAVLLPFKELRLVIVDEEHDSSYKQYDPAPRYQARDAALYLARMYGARTVLGSATPSVESYHHAMEGRYRLVEMKKRYGGFELPETVCVDMRGAGRSHLSQQLVEAIRAALAEGKQAILFQNRRGFSLRIECDDCHEVPQCVHCDVSLVYHKATGTLRCHYCGYSIPVPTECSACGSTHLRMTGVGTERVEEDLQILFPEARVARMDLDSTMGKYKYEELLNDFSEGRIDILVGTQMVTKGLDFERVSVVGVVNADNLINYPNFRSYERAYQQLTQVSGRAGRHGGGAKVFLQSYNPQHEVIERVMKGDYRGMYLTQNEERRVFRYPPYYRLVEVTLKHSDEAVLNAAADWYATQLRSAFGNRVMGPEYPLVSRVRGLYLKRITLRFGKGEPVGEAKSLMMRMADDMVKLEGWSRVTTVFDVDPM